MSQPLDAPSRAVQPPPIDPRGDIVELARALCDMPSESGREAPLADSIEALLEERDHLRVTRLGNTVVARTDLGRERRVVIAGHIDTVPINDNVPSRFETLSEEDAAADVPGTKPGEYLWGRGTVDMKSGVAIQLKLAVELTEPVTDITWMFYDNEEVSAELNGLKKLAEARPDLFEADFAILGEPTSAEIEGGCNGTLRAEIRTRGRRAHSARAWAGSNAIHAAAPILNRLSEYEPAAVEVEGLTYREGLNAVGIHGGIAGNVIPDACMVEVNYRFAPDKNIDEAKRVIEDLFAEFEIEFVDLAEGARPGLDQPVAAEFLKAVGATAKPKYGWTDVARFSAMGVPAVNFGPGDAQKAHADDERVLLEEIRTVERALRAWLTGGDA